MTIKIIIADDHKLMRDGLHALLGRERELEVIATAENGRVAVQLTRKLAPDVVVMDVSMPEMNGIEASRQILAESPDTRIVALSMHSDRRFVEGMLRAGVSSYVLKDSPIEELSYAIRAVMENRAYFSQEIAQTVVKGYLSKLDASEEAVAPLLTPREREVLQLIAEGKKTKEVADLLNVSVKTIETHRRQIMEKLNLRSIAQLTKFAIREGLTTLEN
jgi:two-component system, NarL family, response regulator LiaR